MVDELSAAAARPAIHTPSGIHRGDVNIVRRADPRRVSVGKAFPGVFDDPAAAWNLLESEDAVTMQRRMRDSEAVASRLRINLERLGARCCHIASRRAIEMSAQQASSNFMIPFLAARPAKSRHRLYLRQR